MSRRVVDTSPVFTSSVTYRLKGTVCNIFTWFSLAVNLKKILTYSGRLAWLILQIASKSLTRTNVVSVLTIPLPWSSPFCHTRWYSCKKLYGACHPDHVPREIKCSIYRAPVACSFHRHGDRFIYFELFPVGMIERGVYQLQLRGRNGIWWGNVDGRKGRMKLRFYSGATFHWAELKVYLTSSWSEQLRSSELIHHGVWKPSNSAALKLPHSDEGWRQHRWRDHDCRHRAVRRSCCNSSPILEYCKNLTFEGKEAINQQIFHDFYFSNYFSLFI